MSIFKRLRNLWYVSGLELNIPGTQNIVSYITGNKPATIVGPDVLDIIEGMDL